MRPLHDLSETQSRGSHESRPKHVVTSDERVLPRTLHVIGRLYPPPILSVKMLEHLPDQYTFSILNAKRSLFWTGDLFVLADEFCMLEQRRCQMRCFQLNRMISDLKVLDISMTSQLSPRGFYSSQTHAILFLTENRM